jgi:hypothetical protein
MTDKVVVQSDNLVVGVTAGSVVKVIAGGPKGDRGPGILSNISRITASDTPPIDPELNDLWIDLS